MITKEQAKIGLKIKRINYRGGVDIDTIDKILTSSFRLKESYDKYEFTANNWEILTDEEYLKIFNNGLEELLLDKNPNIKNSIYYLNSLIETINKLEKINGLKYDLNVTDILANINNLITEIKNEIKFNKEDNKEEELLLNKFNLKQKEKELRITIEDRDYYLRNSYFEEAMQHDNLIDILKKEINAYKAGLAAKQHDNKVLTKE